MFFRKTKLPTREDIQRINKEIEILEEHRRNLIESQCKYKPHNVDKFIDEIINQINDKITDKEREKRGVLK